MSELADEIDIELGGYRAVFLKGHESFEPGTGFPCQFIGTLEDCRVFAARIEAGEAEIPCWSPRIERVAPSWVWQPLEAEVAA